MSGHEPKQHSSGKTPSGAHQYIDTLSPMEEDFRPSDGHDAPKGAVVNGLPDYPRGSERTADEVALFEVENFGKYPHDQRRKK